MLDMLIVPPSMDRSSGWFSKFSARGPAVDGKSEPAGLPGGCTIVPSLRIGASMDRSIGLFMTSASAAFSALASTFEVTPALFSSNFPWNVETGPGPLFVA